MDVVASISESVAALRGAIPLVRARRRRCGVCWVLDVTLQKFIFVTSVWSYIDL